MSTYLSSSVSKRSRGHRVGRGFTLVELLVVIAIIGVLVALLLPAVQAAREAARRTSCLNNLTQLGLATHNYEFHFEAFPPGVSDSAGPIRNEAQGQHVGWIVRILPYLEQNALARHFDPSAGAYASTNAAVRATPLGVLQCPSSPVPYLNDAGTTSRSAYAGCHNDTESPIDKDNHGVLYLNSRVRYSDIFDGSSNTILLGEALTSRDSLGWVSGTRATLRNTSSFELGGPYLPPPAGSPVEAAEKSGSLSVGGFGSYHPGGLNVVLADGSTHFLSQTIEQQLLRQLGNRADGEIMKPF